MKKYIAYLKNEHTPHERRAVALRIAGVFTALLFVVWVSTLGLTLSQSSVPQVEFTNTAATLIATDGSTTTIGLPDFGY